jgi:hypothetical protein
MEVEMSDIEQSLKPYAVSPKEAARIENCGLTLIYDRLNAGEYDAVKDGKRTKILLASIEKRRASLPSYRTNKSPPPPPPRKRGRQARKTEAA